MRRPPPLSAAAWGLCLLAVFACTWLSYGLADKLGPLAQTLLAAGSGLAIAGLIAGFLRLHVLASAAHLATMREIDDTMARQAGACFVPLQAALADAGGGLAAAFDSGDGVHPNDAGHALIHQRVQAVVTAHLADGRCSRP